MDRCPSCHEVLVSPAAACCERCGFNLAQTTGAHVTISQGPRVKAHRARIPVEAGVAQLVDRTGSTGSFRVGVPLAAEQILKEISAKACSVRVSVFSSGDLECGETVITHLDGGTIEESLVALRGIHYEGGGDPAETHLDSMAEVLSLIPPAGPTQRNSLVAFFTDVSKPLRSGRTVQSLAAEFKAREVFPVLVCTPGCPLLEEFLKASGGLMFPISNNPSPTEFAGIAPEVAKSIVASLPTAQRTIAVTPSAA